MELKELTDRTLELFAFTRGQKWSRIKLYQGRTYVKRYRDAFNDDYSVNIEPMIEFVSEMFREYWLDSNILKINYPEYYRLIEDAVK